MHGETLRPWSRKPTVCRVFRCRGSPAVCAGPTRSLKSGNRAMTRLPSEYAGGHRSRVTPVPIPNTEVKPATADGTVWETAWESRSLPAVIVDAREKPSRAFSFLCGGDLPPDSVPSDQLEAVGPWSTRDTSPRRSTGREANMKKLGFVLVAFAWASFSVSDLRL